jgi:hypothetical protein
MILPHRRRTLRGTTAGRLLLAESPRIAPVLPYRPTVRRRGVTAPKPRPEGLSRYGAIPCGHHGRGLPTALPANQCLVLARGRWVGLRRYERGYSHGITSVRGNFLPDKEFRYLRTVIVTAAVYRGLGSELRPKANPSP